MRRWWISVTIAIGSIVGLIMEAMTGRTARSGSCRTRDIQPCPCTRLAPDRSRSILLGSRRNGSCSGRCTGRGWRCPAGPWWSCGIARRRLVRPLVVGWLDGLVLLLKENFILKKGNRNRNK